MIKIICVGKQKENYLISATKEYIKRISKYTKIEIVEIKDEKIIAKAPIIEGEKILEKIKPQEYVITLEIEGNQITSPKLAQKIKNTFIHNSVITFIIGGSYGLSEKVKQRSNYSLSFSKMTFPHQLFRVILLEQIYRAFKINNNESYHK